MTGNHGKDKRKKCPLCRGELRDGMSTIPFLIGEKAAVIKDVPAEICSDCGEAYLKSSVVDKLESVLDK